MRFKVSMADAEILSVMKYDKDIIQRETKQSEPIS